MTGIGYVFYRAYARSLGMADAEIERNWPEHPMRKHIEAGAQAVAEEVMRRGASHRSLRQTQVYAWCRLAFGEEHATSLHQRGLRLLEEAVEAYQAAGGSVEIAHRLADHVFSNPAGELNQEFGGVGVTLLALAAAAALSADEEEGREVERVLSKPLEHFRKRNAAKNAAGFNVVGPSLPVGNLDPGQAELMMQQQLGQVRKPALTECVECPLGSCSDCPRNLRHVPHRREDWLAEDIAAADRLLRDGDA